MRFFGLFSKVGCAAAVSAAAGYTTGVRQGKEGTLSWVNVGEEFVGSDMSSKRAKAYNNAAMAMRGECGHKELPSMVMLLGMAYRNAPLDNEHIMNYVLSLISARRCEEATEIINKSPSFNKKTLTPSVATSLGYYYYSTKKDKNAAIEYYQYADTDQSSCLLGEMAQRDGDPETAIKYFNEAIDKNAEYGMAYYRAAQCYIQIGDYKKGEAELTRAVAIYQKNPKAFSKEFQEGRDILYENMPDYSGKLMAIDKIEERYRCELPKSSALGRR